MKCDTCMTRRKAIERNDLSVCGWFMANVICGDLKVDDCPVYKKDGDEITNCSARMDGDAEAQQPHGIDAFIDACPKCLNRNSELCYECRCEKRGAFLPENKPSKRNAAYAAEHKTIRERFEAAFPRCRIDEYGEPAEICPASLAGKECPATDKPTCMNCPAWDWPAE